MPLTTADLDLVLDLQASHAQRSVEVLIDSPIAFAELSGGAEIPEAEAGPGHACCPSPCGARPI